MLSQKHKSGRAQEDVVRFKSILVWTVQCRGCGSEHDLMDLGTFDPDLPPAQPILEPSIFLCRGLAFEVTAHNTYLQRRDLPRSWDIADDVSDAMRGEFRVDTPPVGPVHSYVDFSLNLRQEGVTLRN